MNGKQQELASRGVARNFARGGGGLRLHLDLLHMIFQGIKNMFFIYLFRYTKGPEVHYILGIEKEKIYIGSVYKENHGKKLYTYKAITQFVHSLVAISNSKVDRVCYNIDKAIEVHLPLGFRIDKVRFHPFA